MADLLPTVKISDLPTATDSFEGDFLVVDQSDATRKSTWSSLFSRFGVMRMFSFQDGGTLTSAKDQVIDRTTNKVYQWTGAYPKLVPANSTPESTGGVGTGGWSVNDPSLRGDLAGVNGSTYVGGPAGTVAQSLDGFVTPSQFVGKYPSTTEAVTAMVAYAKTNKKAILAWGWELTLETSVYIDGVEWYGGAFNQSGGNRYMYLSNSTFRWTTFTGVCTRHYGGRLIITDSAWVNNTNTAAMLIQALPIDGTIDILDSDFRGCKYGILQQGTGALITRARFARLNFNDLTGDAIECNVVNRHYKAGGLTIEDINIDNINNTDNSPNWGIGIGVAGQGPYGANASDDQYVSGIIIRNVKMRRVRQCIHFELCRDFKVENVEVYPDASVSNGTLLASGGVVCYGSKDFIIDGVRGEMVNGATRFIYFGWGVNAGVYAAPCRDFTLRNVRTHTGLVDIPVSAKDDWTNTVTVEDVECDTFKYRGLVSRLRLADIRCNKFDGIGDYEAGQGEAGGAMKRWAWCSAEILNINSLDANGVANGSFGQVGFDHVTTYGCNFDVVQHSKTNGNRGVTLLNAGNIYIADNDLFPQGKEFVKGDIILKKTGGLFVVETGGSYIEANDFIRATTVGSKTIQCAADSGVSQPWATRAFKSAGLQLTIPGAGAGGADLKTTVIRAPYQNGAWTTPFYLDIADPIQTATPDNTALVSTNPVVYSERT